MCAMVCPFDVITYHASVAAPEKTAVAIKCDHCIERQRAGQTPACVEACKVGALEFGDINELVKAARTRYSVRALQAVGSELAAAGPAPAPTSIETWREWGAAVNMINADGGR
jgi:carbon-monoxide dehydrogenase iron sulfur subunit